MQLADRAPRHAISQSSASATRLRVLYEQGDVEPLEIVFGATSLDEAMTSLDNLQPRHGQGEDVMSELQARTHAARRSCAQLARAAGRARDRERAGRATASALAQHAAAARAYIALARGAAPADASSRSRARGRGAARRRAARARAHAAVSAAVRAVADAPTVAATRRRPGGRTLTVTATGYALRGTTATGLPSAGASPPSTRR